MRPIHNYHVELMNNGMFNKEHKGDTLHGLKGIRADLTKYLLDLPADTDRIYRDELTEVDYAISDALELLERRTYSETGNSEEDRYARYVTHFIESRIKELILEAK